jgi:hypothetical protein
VIRSTEVMWENVRVVNQRKVISTSVRFAEDQVFDWSAGFLEEENEPRRAKTNFFVQIVDGWCVHENFGRNLITYLSMMIEGKKHQTTRLYHDE